MRRRPRSSRARAYLAAVSADLDLERPPPSEWASKVVACGSGGAGQLGLPEGTRLALKAKDTERSGALLHQIPVQVSAGGTLTLIRCDSGAVCYCGEGSSLPRAKVPTPLPALRHVALVACGHGDHSAAVGVAGELFTWGQGSAGQLGHGQSGCHSSPRVVEALGAVRVVGVACGQEHTAAVTASGDVFTWGSSQGGQLGHGDVATCWLPNRVAGLSVVSTVACGFNHTVALTRTGSLFAWGFGADGRLGLGDESTQSLPNEVAVTADGLPLPPFEHAAAGGRHTLAVTRSGELFSWGSNAHNQLGVSTPRHQAVLRPTRVPLPASKSPVTRVYCGTEHSACQSKDGVAWVWGWNDEGQLGLGDEMPYAVPQAWGRSGVVALALGAAHTVGLVKHERAAEKKVVLRQLLQQKEEEEAAAAAEKRKKIKRRRHPLLAPHAPVSQPQVEPQVEAEAEAEAEVEPDLEVERELMQREEEAERARLRLEREEREQREKEERERREREERERREQEEQEEREREERERGRMEDGDFESVAANDLWRQQRRLERKREARERQRMHIEDVLALQVAADHRRQRAFWRRKFAIVIDQLVSEAAKAAKRRREEARRLEEARVQRELVLMKAEELLCRRRDRLERDERERLEKERKLALAQERRLRAALTRQPTPEEEHWKAQLRRESAHDEFKTEREREEDAVRRLLASKAEERQRLLAERSPNLSPDVLRRARARPRSASMPHLRRPPTAEMDADAAKRIHDRLRRQSMVKRREKEERDRREREELEEKERKAEEQKERDALLARCERQRKAREHMQKVKRERALQRQREKEEEQRADEEMEAAWRRDQEARRQRLRRQQRPAFAAR